MKRRLKRNTLGSEEDEGLVTYEAFSLISTPRSRRELCEIESGDAFMNGEMEVGKGPCVS
jgi:hypothetical protein